MFFFSVIAPTGNPQTSKWKNSKHNKTLWVAISGVQFPVIFMFHFSLNSFFNDDEDTYLLEERKKHTTHNLFFLH